MRGKPPLFRFLGWLGRDLGHAGLRSLIVRVRSALGRTAADRALAGRILERALGRPPRAEEVRAAAEERSLIQADVEATLYLLEEGTAPALTARLEAPALAPFKKALSQGKGLIVASPHFGNYALLLLGLARAGLPLHVMFINSGVYGWIERFGLKVVPFGSGALDYTRALAGNEAVFVFSDLDFFPGGRTADFLGAPIRPPHSLARLSEATGAPVLPVYCLRTQGGWRLETDALIPGGRAEEVEAALLRSMESRLRARPAHWVMFHDPWDVEGTDRANRRRLAAERFFESLIP